MEAAPRHRHANPKTHTAAEVASKYLPPSLIELATTFT